MTRFLYGTHRTADPGQASHVDIVAYAIERGVTLHSAPGYDRALEVIRAAAQRAGATPSVIVKIRGQTPADLRTEVDECLERAGVTRLEGVQLCANPSAALLRPGAPYHTALRKLKDDGVVGAYWLESFWQFSDNLLQVVEDDLFDGISLFYNLFNREASNALFERVSASGKCILAMRPFCGGRLRDGVDPRHVNAKAVERAPEFAPYFDTIFELHARAGSATRIDTALRFLLGVPAVRGIVGSTTRREHLDDLIERTTSLPPLEPALVAELQALHATWWKDSGAGYTPNTSTSVTRRGAATAMHKLRKKVKRLFGR